MLVLAFCLTVPASAQIITGVVRSGGVTGDRDPIGAYDVNTAPLATEAGGLTDGNLVFSDRTYPLAGTPALLDGSEYIRTFNSDKSSGDVTYELTTSQDATVWIALDDRFSSQQEMIDYVTAAAGIADAFVDTGLNIHVREKDDGSRDRPLSVFAGVLPAGTYVLGGDLDGANNFVVIGATSETIIPAFTPGDIAISTQAGWYSQDAADREMQEVVDNVTGASVELFPANQHVCLVGWVVMHTGDGVADLLILNGVFPDFLYPGGNALPDGSLAEAFLDDGNIIINTGDYMFYVNNAGANNDVSGLHNMMDIVVDMWDDNTSVPMTPEGHAFAPSLLDFQTDRPFHLDQLTGDWEPELILAQNASGTRADGVIVVNTATGGRLGIFYQTASQDDDPRGEVISEWINNWYLAGGLGIPNSNAWKLAPEDGAISIGLDDDVSWAMGIGAASHDVYFGTEIPPAYAGSVDAVADVTAPGDVVQGVPDEARDGDIAGWPGGEYPALAIDDNTGTKFLHFAGDVEPTGIQVTPAAGWSVVTGLTLTTANDSPGRDPIAYELSGSNGSIDGPYELIAAGDVVDFAQEGEYPRFTMNETVIAFDNDVAYDHYQIMFPMIRDTADNSMQIAEIELIGITERASFDPGTLEYGNTYFLQVDTVAADGSVLSGDLQSLTTTTPVGIFEYTQDIGGPAGVGRTTYEGYVWKDDMLTEQYLIMGGGADIWGTSDQFHFAWNRVSGDVRLSASFDWIVGGTGDWAKYGVMLRESNTGPSAHYYMCDRKNQDYAAVQYRPSTGASSSAGAEWNANNAKALGIQKITFAGQTWIEGLVDKGNGWESTGLMAVNLADDLLAGVAVDAANNNSLVQARAWNINYELNPERVGELTLVPASADLGAPTSDVSGFSIRSLAPLVSDGWGYDAMNELLDTGTWMGLPAMPGSEGTRIDEFVNLRDTANGAFSEANGYPDASFPGIDALEVPAQDPADGDDDDNFATEILGCIQLTAGVHIIGANSDDGTILEIGGVEIIRTGEWKGASNEDYFFEVEADGYYDLRARTMEGGGGANIELHEILMDGTRLLLNDVANGGSAVFAPAP